MTEMQVLDKYQFLFVPVGTYLMTFLQMFDTGKVWISKYIYGSRKLEVKTLGNPYSLDFFFPLKHLIAKLPSETLN